MELVEIEVCGFKRFRQKTSIKLNGKIIAIVGPNEAGKTTLLEAIGVSGFGGFIEDGHISQNTPETTYVESTYFISSEKAAGYGLSNPSWLTYKVTNDTNYFNIKPSPSRNLDARKALSLELKSILGRTSSVEFLKEEYGEISLNKIRDVKTLVDQTMEYSSENLDLFSEVKDYFNEDFWEASKGKELEIFESIDSLVKFENEHDPLKEAFNRLRRDIPKILKFTQADRNLGIPFDMKTYATAGTEPSKNLVRLASLAGLNLSELGDSIIKADLAKRESLLEDANVALKSKLTDFWTQSNASLELKIVDGKLDIVVRHPAFKNAKFIHYSKRSDGFKQFVALAVFCLIEGGEGGILLIDEAETHLHYDAQADLIQVLGNQTFAKKVIYSTHSAGCLPEDLGNGVRLVRWRPDAKGESEVVNKFWAASSDPLFDPLLIGMGAATFAFFPTRRALMAEGISEMLLLSRMLRECAERQKLDFQIVPGLSNLKNTQLPITNLAENKIAFIVDNDGGGADIIANLVGCGVNPNRIKRISNLASATTLEDCLKKEIWLQAVNTCIDKFCPDLEHLVDASDSGRIEELPEKFKN